MIQRRPPIKQRILTAVVLLPLLFLFLFFANDTWFTVFITLVSALALHEFYSMSLPDSRMYEKGLAIGFGSLLVPTVAFGPAQALQGGLTFALFFFGLVFLCRFLELTQVITQLALVFFGFCYIPLLLSHLVLLHNLPSGKEWIFLVLLMVMASDSSAYFTGISLGRHRLYPAISPKKSIEGAVGGLLGSLGAAFLARWWFFPALGVVDCLLLGFILGCLGQAGDLFESMIKRAFQVKDSGTLVPGHGGILDRLDSLLFTFPVAYYYGLFLF